MRVGQPLHSHSSLSTPQSLLAGRDEARGDPPFEPVRRADVAPDDAIDLAIRADDIPNAVVRHARLLHVDDLDEDASIAAARIAAGSGVPVTSDVDRVTHHTAALIALSTVPIFSAHVPSALTSESDPERALRRLRKSHAGWLCVTLGTNGAMLLEGDRLHHVPAFAVDAVDTTGAGDVFRAAFIYALLQSQGPAEILRFASAAAAISCTREGAMTSVPSLAEVEQLLRVEL